MVYTIDATVIEDDLVFKSCFNSGTFAKVLFKRFNSKKVGEF